MILLAYFSSNHKYDGDNLPFWRAFDNTQYFSIDHRTQRRYILFTGLICLPTILTGALLINWNRYYLYSKHPGIKPYIDSVNPYLEPSLHIALMILSTVGTFLRLRPYMTMLYAIICVRKHLNNLNMQVAAYYKENRNLMALKGPKIEIYEHTGRSKNHFGIIVKDIELVLTSRKAMSRDRRIDSINSIILSETASGQSSTIMSANADSKTKSYLTISNLHELNNHLIQINLFIKQIDIESSIVVYITIFYHFMVLMYAFFIYREFTISIRQILIIVYNLSGLLPPLTLFTCGTLMEHESRNLVTKLEFMYLQEETHCFMYRQLSGMKYPLWSIFKLCGSIEFNCDQLMHISLGTLQEIIILISTSALVIKQYGKCSEIFKASMMCRKWILTIEYFQ